MPRYIIALVYPTKAMWPTTYRTVDAPDAESAFKRVQERYPAYNALCLGSCADLRERINRESYAGAPTDGKIE